MKYVYPAVFHPEVDGGFSISFPDIQMGGTQGESIAEGMKMAEDFLCLAMYNIEEDGLEVPPASNPRDVQAEEDDIVTLIVADVDAYRRYVDSRLVKKTVNIPAWLNQRAEDAQINFSKALQRGLKEELNIAE